MKNILFTISFMLLLFTSLTAQNERKGYIGIALGGAAPIGDFADTDIRNEDAGLASSGISLRLIDFGYKFNERLGIAANIGGGVFPIDEDLDINWVYAGLYVGPIVSFPLNDRLDLNFIPKIGTVSVSIMADDEELAEESGRGFDLGLSLRYNFKPKWSLSFNSGYVQTNLDETKLTSINTNVGIAFRLK